MCEINLEKLPIFDTHAHYASEQFEPDLEQVVAQMKQNGVIGVINCGVNYENCKKNIELAEKYDLFYAAVGVHPEDLYDGKNLDTTLLKEFCGHEKVVAIGEIGLDYYWDNFSHEEQKKWFEQQIMFAKEVSLPVIVHDRESHADTLEILKKHKPSGVVHCFSGSAEMAQEILNLGMYIGLGGVITFKNAMKVIRVAAMLPLDRLLLETDAPYMSPEPFRGKRCTSDLIYFVAEKIARIKGVTTEAVLKASNENAKRLFTKIK